MLDSGNTSKQSKRTHLCVMVEVNANTFYVPLRNNLGKEDSGSAVQKNQK